MRLPSRAPPRGTHGASAGARAACQDRPMRSILRRLPGDLPIAYLLLPILVAGLWPVLWGYITLMAGPRGAMRWWPVTDGSLLVGLFVALGVWTTGHVRGA